jgi:Uma2 family endonuclease
MAGERNLAAAAGGGIDWIRSIAAEFRGLKRATYEDVLNAPEHKVAEILDGELFLSPRPAPRHSVASSRLGAVLGPFDYGDDGPGAWWIISEPECHFGENVLVPDLGGWRRDRMLAVPDTAFFSLAPDWVCEVLSPSTERIDRGRKLRIYAEAGVAHMWLINPVERTLEVLRLRDGAWTIVAVCSGSDAVRVEPFDAIELALARLWVDSPASPDPLQPGPG